MTPSANTMGRRRAALVFGVSVLALALAGCASEADQRQAFIAFLRTRILDKPGLHIPIMSDEDARSFGRYADHYRIMNGFHHRLNAAISADLARASQIGSPQALSELASRRAIFPILIAGMTRMKGEVEKAIAEADAAHAALEQPVDLKAVYDAAYAKMVSRPASIFLDLIPAILKALPALEELAVFLDQNRDAIVYEGGRPVTNDPQVRAKLITLMQAATVASQASEDGKRKLRALTSGN